MRSRRNTSWLSNELQGGAAVSSFSPRQDRPQGFSAMIPGSRHRDHARHRPSDPADPSTALPRRPRCPPPDLGTAATGRAPGASGRFHGAEETGSRRDREYWGRRIVRGGTTARRAKRPAARTVVSHAQQTEDRLGLLAQPTASPARAARRASLPDAASIALPTMVREFVRPVGTQPDGHPARSHRCGFVPGWELGVGMWHFNEKSCTSVTLVASSSRLHRSPWCLPG